MSCQQTADSYIVSVCYEYDVFPVSKGSEGFEFGRGEHKNLSIKR